MDWNADGLKDLLVGENNGQVRHFRNIGTVGNPQLTYVGLIQLGNRDLDVGDYSIPWTNDWNEDGLIDLLVGESDGVVNLYINVGTNASPTFSSEAYLMAGGVQLDVGYRSGPNVIDLNGDGVKDVVSGEMGGKAYFFENNGTNSAPDLAAGVYLMNGSQEIATSGTSRTTPIDWDNDGDMDLVIGSYDAFLRRYMQVTTTVAAPTCDINNTGSYIIPASGGRLQYSVAATNSNPTTVVFDAWTKIKNPNSTWTGPLINRPDVTLGPGGNITRNLWLEIPASWATGYYYMYLYVGDYSTNQIYDDDYIYFYKTPTGDGLGPVVKEFAFSNWEDDPCAQAMAPLPETVSLNASPNPFNPTTTLTFALPEAGAVKVEIFNATGQKVTTLVNGYHDAGQHQATWDASDMPSGVYLVSLEAGLMKTTTKLLLVK